MRPASTLLAGLIPLLVLTACGGSEPDDDDAAVADTSGDTTPPPSPGGLHFTDGSGALGAPPQRLRGVALVDFDLDGWPDITLAGEEGVSLYRGDGSGGFELVLGAIDGVSHGAGVAWVDVDADGNLDLFVSTHEGPDHLFIADGQGGFTDESAARGIVGSTWGEGASFGDLDGDGDLDLYLNQGITRSDAAGGGELGQRGNPNRVYENDGKGTFKNVTEAWGLAGAPKGESFTALLFDANGDGRTDVFTVHDNAPDQLFLGQGAGKAFTDASATMLPTDETSLMGLALADFDGDGQLDIYGTTAGRDLLYLRSPEGGFVNQYPQAIGDGVDQSELLIGWGAALVDMDHDGDADVITTASYSDGKQYDDTVIRPGQLVVLRHDPAEQGPGILVDVTTDAGDVLFPTINGWGLATGDIDHDGDVDILVATDRQIDAAAIPAGDSPHRRALLLLNGTPPAGPAIHVTLRAPGTPNPFAVGARVTLTLQERSATRMVLAGSSYLSQHEYGLHFGLGEDYQVAPVVRVTWPDGVEQLWLALPPGRHTLTRDADNRCCDPDGTCQALEETPCLARLSELLGTSEACAGVCDKLDGCGQLARVEVSSRAECVSACGSEPAPLRVLTCVQDTACDSLGDCFEER